nr:hypothetical protein [Paenibacillus sp. EZ-K15]
MHKGVVIGSMMSHICIDSTVRTANRLGYEAALYKLVPIVWTL